MKRILLASLLFLLEFGLRAQDAPVITTQPAGQITFAGGSASFSVEASGTGPFLYQWLLNGTNFPLRITTFAGTGAAGSYGDGGSAAQASLYAPFGIAVDASGNLFVADSNNGRIRRVGTDGIITMVAGNGLGGYSGDGGPATNASMDTPSGIAVDRWGNLYVADTGNCLIRRVDTNGNITTIAGNPSLILSGGDFSGNGGAATNASLNYPLGVAVDGNGAIFIADTYNQRIRRVSTDGIITTVAGGGSYGDGIAATNAILNSPSGIALDAAGNLFIADTYDNSVRRVGTNGIITTAAGNGYGEYSGDGGAATNASLFHPLGVTFDSLGNLLIADTSNGRVRRVDTDGIITTMAGGGGGGDGSLGTKASLLRPSGVAADSFGNLYLSEGARNDVRMLTAQGSTLVTDGATAGDAGAYTVQITSPFGGVASAPGWWTVIQQPLPGTSIIPAGGSATFSVSALGPAPCGFQWFLAGKALPDQTNAVLSLSNLTVSAAGNYTVAAMGCDSGAVSSDSAELEVGLPPTISVQPTNQSILPGSSIALEVGVAGSGPFAYQWQYNGANIPAIINTIAGSGEGYPYYLLFGPTGSFSGDGGPAVAAGLYHPYGMAVDRNGNLYLADYNNNRVRRVDTNGIITTVAGNGTSGYSGDGGAATNATLSLPAGVAVDDFGNLLIADCYNNVIRRVDTNGLITTIAGTGSAGDSGDGGPATNARLYGPSSVALDRSGNLFIADTGNCVVRRVGTNGNITLLAGGFGLPGFTGDGGPATNATLYRPSAVTVDNFGTVFIADSGNNRIRKVDTYGTITTVAGNGFGAPFIPWGPSTTTPNGGFSGDGGPATNAEFTFPSGVAVDGFGNLFIADSYNDRIREVGTNGIITTVAGNGFSEPFYPPDGSQIDRPGGGFSGDGGAPTNAEFALPSSVMVDRFGNLFIADTFNNHIREIAAGGSALDLNGAFAGNFDVVITSPYGSITSSVASMTLATPVSVTQPPQSQVAAAGQSATFRVSAAGTIPINYQWYFDGSALTGQTNQFLSLPYVVPASAGDYFVVLDNSASSVTSAVAILTVGFAPTITTQPVNVVAYNGANARFSVAVSGTGPFTWRWQFNGADLPGIKTVAGNGTAGFAGDGGPAAGAQLDKPLSLAIDAQGDLFIADYNNNRIRKIDRTGVITTAAGNGLRGFAGDGGVAAGAALNNPIGVAVDDSGNVAIADTSNNRVRKVDTNNIITTVAGNGSIGHQGDGGSATNASLLSPFGVTFDALGGLFIADTGDSIIRNAGTDGVITRTAGEFGNAGFAGDGGPATNAALTYPRSVALDPAGNLFIADFDNQRIRKVDTNGVITTVVGNGVAGYSGDGGPATNASLFEPFGVVTDHAGNLYLTDSGNNRIRMVDTNGIISTVAGNGTNGYSGDGGAATNAALSNPTGIIVDDGGNLFFADADNNRIRQVTIPGPTLPLNNVSAGNAGNYDVVVTGLFGSVTSSIVTLTVVLPPLQTTIVNGGGLSLQLTGTAGQTYVLQAATNLAAPVNWQPVFTNTADAGGKWSYVNSNLPTNPAVFYRVTAP